MSRYLANAVVLGVAACATARPAMSPVQGTTPAGIRYDVRGSGPTVVLIHGGVLDRRMWDHEATAWESRFRVVRYDLRGHGQSADISGPYSALDDLAAVLDAVGARRAHLVGLSLGSRVALDFAIARPERVDRLVLAGPFPSGAVPTEKPPFVDSLMAAAQRGDVERAAAVVAASEVMAVPPKETARVRGIVLSNARLFRQSPTAERALQPPALGRLAEVRAPTLVIVGSRDARDVQLAADTLSRGIRGAARVTVPGAGHLVNIWEPALFSRVVTDFLVGKPPDSGALRRAPAQ